MYFTLACGATIAWGFASKGASFASYGRGVPLLYFGYWFVSGVLLHFPSLVWPRKKLTDRLRKVQLIAHRGGRVQTPENTLAAFENAVKRGAQQVEFDVWESKDKVREVTGGSTMTRLRKLVVVFLVGAARRSRGLRGSRGEVERVGGGG